MADDEREELIEVPIPGGDEGERQRIRSSNDRDQEKERHGEPSRHNRGYDEAVKGRQPEPEIDRVVEE